VTRDTPDCDLRQSYRPRNAGPRTERNTTFTATAVNAFVEDAL